MGPVWRLVECGSHNNRGQADRFPQCRVCGEMPQALHRYNLPLTTVVIRNRRVIELKIERSEEEQKRANEMFDALRDELYKRDLYNSESYDKAILTLSAASLGLSLTAIRFVVPLETAEQIIALQAGWVLLLISIFTSLSAYLISNKAIEVQMKNAELYYLEGEKEALNVKNRYTRLNASLNYATGGIFLIAISLIIYFVLININPEETQMANKDSGNGTTKEFFRDSANVPTMQRVETGGEVIKRSANIPTMQPAPSGGSSSTGSSSGSQSTSGSSSSSGSSGDGK